MVSFGDVTIRNYPIILGANPATSLGAPVCIDWEYTEQEPLPVDDYENSRKGKRRTKQHYMYLSYYRRQEILHNAGYTDKEFKQAERQVSRIHWSRKFHYYWSFPVLVQKNVTGSFARRRNRRVIRKYRNEMKKAKQQQIENKPRGSLRRVPRSCLEQQCKTISNKMHHENTQ